MIENTTKIKIRPASDADIDAMCDLSDQINAQHHLHAPAVFVAHPNRQLDRLFWQATFQSPHGTALLACDVTGVLGFITLSWHENLTIPFLYSRKICRIGTIVVAEHCQKNGIGKLLMEAATAWGREHQTVEIRLEVFDFNRNAIGFYEALGYGMQSHIMCKTLS